ncbi:MAG: hypothetical protein COB38_05795 [Gammaproteobacteria bacterium]|nr:MAG: hypothetical protein COB38_05795 [Gammaproteobacteria bacterium]
MSLVYRNENPLFVHSAKNILDINGIDSFLKNEHGSTMGPEFGSSNLLELWVSNSDDCNKALSLIENESKKQAIKPSWLCGECKEENEGNFELCWNCQSNRGGL